MGFFGSLAKYTIFLFNLVFVIVGLAFLVLGIIFKLKLDEDVFQEESAVYQLALAPILLIVIGCIVFVIAFLGCCGAIKKNSCMLISYGIILLVLLALQLALGIFALVQIKDNTDLRKAVSDALKANLENYSTNEAVKVYIDEIQSTLKCCGVGGPVDWNHILDTQPPSCKDTVSGILYSDGCGEKVYDLLADNVKIVGIVAIVLCSVELVGAILAFVVAKKG